MKLTQLQYRALKIYTRYRDAGFGVGQWLRTCWRNWLILVVTGGLVYLFIVPTFAIAGWLSIGMCLGALLRDAGNYQAAVRIWPVSQKIIDWKRVSELVEAHEKDAG
jgi:hypothetical protein